MIAQVRDRSGRVLGQREITGTRWIAAHNGFVNDTEFTIRVVVEGWPTSIVLLNLMGERVSGTSELNIRNCEEPVRPGDILLLSPGEATIALQP